jgi:hypothetical protein
MPANDIPHTPQNFSSGPIGSPHPGQTGRSEMTVPQVPQNFASRLMSARHCGQNFIDPLVFTSVPESAGAPQELQNRCDPVNGALQREHVRSFLNSFPHPVQNRQSGRLMVPHAGQVFWV